MPSAELAAAELWPRACFSLRGRARHDPWLLALCDIAERVMGHHAHGDLPGWRAALQALPQVECGMDGGRAAPRLGAKAPDPERLQEILLSFHPWRKGPLELAGVLIDTEWRSDWKWERVRKHVDLHDRCVLDIGCGNGYFGWRMLAEGARLVVGVDPTLVFVMQWLACWHFAGDEPNYVLPLAIEDLPAGPADFDAVFSMGVLYHRRDPAAHLAQLHGLLRRGGTLVLETLVLPGEAADPVLVPTARYARMRNVWAIPSLQRLLQWVETAGFESPRVADVSATTTEEQRSTAWMRFESLAESLNSRDTGRTVEGYPAPTRALIIAQR